MAQAQAEGARSVAGTEVVVKRVPELVPAEVAKSSGFKLDQAAPIADPGRARRLRRDHLRHADTLRQHGAQMRNFLDQTGGLWMQGALIGKVGSVFCSTATQHGGQETTITSFHTTLLHHGMIVVGLPYKFTELSGMDEIQGGTPYGASCVTGSGATGADAHRARAAAVPPPGQPRGRDHATVRARGNGGLSPPARAGAAAGEYVRRRAGPAACHELSGHADLEDCGPSSRRRSRSEPDAHQTCRG